MFKVDQIDHVHVYVADQFSGAAWYREVLGLEIVESLSPFAGDGGPLTISSDDGNTALALFPKGQKTETNRSTVAFRVGGENFLRFLVHLEQVQVFDSGGARVGRENVSDHSGSWSVYFCDEDGNPIEVTTYDYEAVKSGLVLS